MKLKKFSHPKHGTTESFIFKEVDLKIEIIRNTKITFIRSENDLFEQMIKYLLSQTGLVVKRYPLESIVSVGCLRGRVEALSPSLRDSSTNLVVRQETSFASPLVRKDLRF